jgi:DNA (cytosine-5)-methyltransferase 1
MRYVSICCGVDGFARAFTKFKVDCVMASDSDQIVQKAYRLLYPRHDLRGAIEDINWWDVPEHEILTAGFPCQPFSVGGYKLGFADTRGTVFYYIAEVVKHKKPKVVILENVKGLLNHDEGRTLDTILHTMNEIGYTVDFNIVNSKFWLPQSRDRVYIVCIRDDLVKPERLKTKGSDAVAKARKRFANYMMIKTFNFPWPARTIVRSQLRDILDEAPEERHYLTADKINVLVNAMRAANMEYPFMNGLGGYDFTSHVADQVSFSVNGQGIAYCIDANYWKGTSPSSVDNSKRTQVIEYDDNHTAFRVRKLTPLECFRAQGFPDFIPKTLSENGISNTNLYTMAGNAVSVPVVEELIGEVLKHL